MLECKPFFRQAPTRKYIKVVFGHAITNTVCCKFKRSPCCSTRPATVGLKGVASDSISYGYVGQRPFLCHEEMTLQRTITLSSVASTYLHNPNPKARNNQSLQVMFTLPLRAQASSEHHRHCQTPALCQTLCLQTVVEFSELLTLAVLAWCISTACSFKAHLGLRDSLNIDTIKTAAKHYVKELFTSGERTFL